MSSSRLFLYTSKSLAQAVAATVVYIYKTFSFCVRSIHVPIYMLNVRVFFICFLFVGWIQLRQNVKLVASKIIERHNMHLYRLSLLYSKYACCESDILEWNTNRQITVQILCLHVIHQFAYQIIYCDLLKAKTIRQIKLIYNPYPS